MNKVQRDSFDSTRTWGSLHQYAKGKNEMIRGTVYTPLGPVEVYGVRWSNRGKGLARSSFKYYYGGRVYTKWYADRSFTALGFKRMAAPFAREVRAFVVQYKDLTTRTRAMVWANKK